MTWINLPPAGGGGDSGSAITSLIGDIIANGPGAASATIAPGVIVNAYISASAAIALTKLAATTSSRALVSDGSGFITASTTTATQVGYLSTATSDIQTQITARALKVDVQVFESSGTWTRPAGALLVEVICIGSGGGGASGTKQASGTQTCGGGSGAGAAISIKKILASSLGATETVTIAAGGTGGAIVTTDNTAANPGGNGGQSSFGIWCRAGAGNGAGTYSTGVSPAGTAGSSALGTFPGTAGRTGTLGDQGIGATQASSKGCAAGAAGGGISTVPAAKVGGDCGNTNFFDANFTTIPNTPVGSIAGNGQNGGFAAGQPGGGGASSITGNGGNAGTTGKYGSGGSGGGSSLNGASRDAGAGADGAAGVCVVMTWF